MRSGTVTRADLRPLDWQQIWPEYTPPAAGAALSEGPVRPLRGKAQGANASVKARKERTRRAVQRAATRSDMAARATAKQQAHKEAA